MEARPPLVSILTALRTGWQYLPEAAASVRHQTFDGWEWLIGVNDGPRWNGDHLEIASDLLRPTVALAVLSEERIRVFDLSEARNKPDVLRYLLKAARAPLVAIIDSDDSWQPDKLARQVVSIDRGDYDVLGTAGEWFGAASGPIRVDCGPIDFGQLLERNHIINSSVLMRRDCCRWPDTDGLDDYPLWLQLAHEGRRLYNLSESLVKIRVHPEQHFGNGRRDDSAAIRERWRMMAHAK